MKQIRSFLWCGALVLPLALALQLRGAEPAEAAAEAPPKRSLTEQIKQPVDWMSWGADLRFRNEYFRNAMTLSPDLPNNEQDYFRYRGRLWTELRPYETVAFNLRLTTEARTWMKPAAYTPFRGNTGTDWSYGVFDQVSITLKDPFDLPATLRVGRQDIRFGDGWLILEGTPWDGSWTIFMDAARLTYQLPEQKTTIDLVGIYQNAYEGEWMPAIHPQDRALTDQTEKGAILYVANKTMPALNIDGFFIYRNDERALATGDNADIYTIGARLAGTFKEHWNYALEGAYQFGRKEDLNVRYPAPTTGYRDIDAFGLHGRLTYELKDPLNNRFSLFYEYLSGDNPNTEADEMFDILWGRWPRWSELYNVYSYVFETRVSQTANVHRVGPGWSFTPVKNLDFSVNYNLLFANESVPTRAGNQTLFTNDGYFRGHYLQTVLRYRFNKSLNGHLWAEWVFPGDYYTSREALTFLRAELLYTF